MTLPDPALERDRNPARSGSMLLSVSTVALPIIGLLLSAGGIRLALLLAISAGAPIQENAFPYLIDLGIGTAFIVTGLTLSLFRIRTSSSAIVGLVLSLVCLILVGTLAWAAISFDGGSV